MSEPHVTRWAGGELRTLIDVLASFEDGRRINAVGSNSILNHDQSAMLCTSGGGLLCEPVEGADPLYICTRDLMRVSLAYGTASCWAEGNSLYISHRWGISDYDEFIISGSEKNPYTKTTEIPTFNGSGPIVIGGGTLARAMELCETCTPAMEIRYGGSEITFCSYGSDTNRHFCMKRKLSEGPDCSMESIYDIRLMDCLKHLNRKRLELYIETDGIMRVGTTIGDIDIDLYIAARVRGD